MSNTLRIRSRPLNTPFVYRSCLETFLAHFVTAKERFILGLCDKRTRICPLASRTRQILFRMRVIFHECYLKVQYISARVLVSVDSSLVVGYLISTRWDDREISRETDRKFFSMLRLSIPSSSFDYSSYYCILVWWGYRLEFHCAPSNKLELTTNYFFYNQFCELNKKIKIIEVILNRLVFKDPGTRETHWIKTRNGTARYIPRLIWSVPVVKYDLP